MTPASAVAARPASSFFSHTRRWAALTGTAAAGVAEAIEVDGGCGVGTVAFQAPELYALAGLIELFRSAVQLGQAYDWAVGIKAASEI